AGRVTVLAGADQLRARGRREDADLAGVAADRGEVLAARSDRSRRPRVAAVVGAQEDACADREPMLAIREPEVVEDRPGVGHASPRDAAVERLEDLRAARRVARSRVE